METIEVDAEHFRAVMEENKRLKSDNASLLAWMDNTWIKKGTPDINTTVLIKHELGAGGNYDVACYMGRDLAGNDRYMMSHGTEIFKKHVVKYRLIEELQKEVA